MAWSEALVLSCGSVWLSGKHESSGSSKIAERITTKGQSSTSKCGTPDRVLHEEIFLPFAGGASSVLSRSCWPRLLKMTSDTVVEEIIARVNNSIVTRSRSAQGARAVALSEAHQQPDSASSRNSRPRNTEKGTLLRDLIDQQLLLGKRPRTWASAPTPIW